MEKNWRIRAYELFFYEHKSINDIADEIKISRQHVSKYLKSCHLYEKERESRKRVNKSKRKEYQREWDRKNRSVYSSVDADTIKREHCEAVNVLSYEKF